MNFFGHAVVGVRLGHAPRAVLGAMLPDLAAMCGLRLRSCTDDQLAAGIVLHHRCDAVFHGERAFVGLVARSRLRMERLGLRAGPARAVAHVGIELLCDGVYGDDEEAVRAYRRALEEIDAEGLARALAWDPEEGYRLLELGDRLAAAPLPEAYRDPDAASTRLEGVLRRRPRLALRATEVTLVSRWLREVHPVVEAVAEPLLEAVLAGVRDGAAAPSPL